MNSIGKKIIHFHLKEIQNIGGFSLTNVEKGNYFWMLVRSTTNSDESVFFKYIEQLSNLVFNKAGINPNAVYQFLIMIHIDQSADLYINDFPVMIEFMAKRDVKKGEAITKRDIADIRRLRFPDIKITNTDQVIYCFKEGWKFGLFFDLDHKLDLDKMELDLGALYRNLSFQYIYEVLKNETHFEEMRKDGWFPFIEIIGSEFKALSEKYTNKFHFEEGINKIVNKFNKERIETIKNKWWKKQIFKDKEQILQAGTNAFLSGDNEGYINCINTILPQIEGIIRLQYFTETGEGHVGINELLSYLTEKGKTKSGSGESLLLMVPFFNYLKDIVYANYNVETGQLDLSRHSLSHGVAKAETYTRIKALQAILIIDQIYFYI